MKTLMVGLIGTGSIGAHHARGWQQAAPRAELVAVADVAAGRARQFAAEHTNGQASVYTSTEALLADPAVDAVDICLPHHLHTDAIVAAARAGKAILCEKPLCTSFADAATIGAALQETGVRFMPAHNQLFQPSLIEARRLLGLGAIGQPFVLRSIEAIQNRRFQTRPDPNAGNGQDDGESPFAWRMDPDRMGGGEVLDTGWHATYRLLALANERPVAVTAMMERFLAHGLPAEDTGLLLVRFASGAIGQITTS